MISVAIYASQQNLKKFVLDLLIVKFIPGEVWSMNMTIFQRVGTGSEIITTDTMRVFELGSVQSLYRQSVLVCST